MAMRGGRGGHDRPPGGHVGRGGPSGFGGGHGGHDRPSGPPGGRMLYPIPVFGHGGMMGIGWMFAPLMFIFFIALLLAEVIASPVFLVGCLLVLAAVVLNQRRPKEKTKRKRGTFEGEDDAYFYDDEFYNE